MYVLPTWLQDFPEDEVVVELGVLLVAEEELAALLAAEAEEELVAPPVVEAELGALLFHEMDPSPGVGVFLNADVMNDTAGVYAPSALFK